MAFCKILSFICYTWPNIHHLLALMDSLNTDSQVVTIDWTERWQVYQRLQELQIPCQCLPNQPLQVNLSSPSAAIQLWSVVRHFTASRQELADWLKHCWQVSINDS